MSYRLIIIYSGPFSHKLDRKINSAVYGGRRQRQLSIEFEGSGYGFGERDMTYVLPSALMAKAAVARVQKIDGVRAVYERY